MEAFLRANNYNCSYLFNIYCYILVRFILIYYFSAAFGFEQNSVYSLNIAVDIIFGFDILLSIIHCLIIL